MIRIYNTETHIPALRDIIATEYRLDELVDIVDLLDARPEPSGWNMLVRKDGQIGQPIDWHNTQPPYVFPEAIPLNAQHLLGLIFLKLGNLEKAGDYLQHNPVLHNEADIFQHLRDGQPVDPHRLTTGYEPFEEYRLCHNTAVLMHYAATEQNFDPDKTAYFYEEALKSAPNGEYQAYTARHFAQFLLDISQTDAAMQLVQDALNYALSDDAVTELKAIWCQIAMKKLVVPYDQTTLDTLKEHLWTVLEQYKAQERVVEEALLLQDAAQVANYTESFAEALGYITRAVDIFRQERLPELLANAQYRRGILLYTWAQQGQPQFYRAALESFQEALKVFNRDEAPDTFADIHQYLGVIYAEMPDDPKKKSIWAGISAASFQQAMQYYTADKHPYEYARVCANYANALTKYPDAVHTDNMEKALFYYAAALEIRSAAQWPLERAVTLLNYVETCWHLNLAGRDSDTPVFEEMLHKTREALSLTKDPFIIRQAEEQLEKLEQLRQVLAGETA
jgi:tetratricopeptide (TPR) repeat protein